MVCPLALPLPPTMRVLSLQASAQQAALGAPDRPQARPGLMARSFMGGVGHPAPVPTS